MKKLFIISLISFLLFSVDAIAGKRYYVGGNSTWNTTASWSSVVGGGGGGASGASVPSTNDTAYFNTGDTCTMDANGSVKRMEMTGGKLLQGTYTLTFGTTGATFSGGTFAGGSGAITATGAFTISGCAFTSTSGTFSTNSNFTLSSGSFTHNSGLLKFTASNTVTGTMTLFKMEFAANSAYTFTIASGTTLTVNDTLFFTGSAGYSINTGNISAHGDIVITNTSNGTGGNATLTVNGTGNQSFVGGTLGATGRMPNVVINKSSGTLSLSNTIAVAGNWTYTAGTLNAGTSRIHFVGTKTISGSHTLYDVRLGAASTFTISGGTTLTTTGTLEFANGTTGNIKVNTGTINAEGNINLKNPVAGGGGTGSVVINGTGSQTLTGNAVEGYAALPNVTINKSSGTLTLDSVITVAGDWTYTAGTLSTGTSTVCFWNTKSITGSHTLSNVSFNQSANSAYAIGGATTLTITGLLTIGGSNEATINTGTINAQGNIALPNTYNSNTAGGSASLVINGTSSQSLTGNSTKGNSRLPNVTINKSSGTLSLYNTISVQGDFTYTAGTMNEGTSTVHFAGNKTITCSDTLYTVSFGASTNFTFTIAGGTILPVKGDLEISGSSNATFNTGTIYVKGNITTTNTGTGGGGTATIVINGTGSQTFTGSGTAGAGKFPNITVDKTSGTLTLASIISVEGNWIYTKGRVSPGTTTVALYGSFNLDGQKTSSDSTMQFYRIQVTTGTRTLTGDVYCKENFAFTTGTTVTASTYDITVGGNWNGQGTWSHGNDTITFTAGGYNKIQGPSGGSVNFAHVVMNRRSGSLTCVNPVTIDSSLSLRLGRIKTTTTNYLQFGNDAKCVMFNDDSAYVHGPVRKVGNDAFSFPLGDTTLHDSIAYHPLGISAPGSTGDSYEAVYRAIGQTLGSTLVDTLTSISNCEYWNIEKKAGSSNVYVTVSWNRNSCGVENYDDLRLAGWSSSASKWVDIGASNLVPGAPVGSLRTGAVVAFTTQANQYVVIGQRPNTNPYATLKKKLDAGYYSCSNGKLMFRFEDEYNDPDAKLSFCIYNDAYGRVSSDQMISSGSVPNVYYGSNYYLLNVLDCNVVPNGNVANGFYILEVINEKNEHWFLRFKHTTSLNPNCTGNGENQ